MYVLCITKKPKTIKKYVYTSITCGWLLLNYANKIFILSGKLLVDIIPENILLLFKKINFIQTIMELFVSQIYSSFLLHMLKLASG